LAAPRSRAFDLGLAGALLLAMALSVYVATQEWFSRDDFLFLARVQGEAWSWRDAFLPLEHRTWAFYRPLSFDAWFRLGFLVFGMNALGFFLVSLALHFVTGVLVHRLAVQLGFAAPVAAATAILAVTRAPSLTEIFYGSCFMYVSEVFFALACLTFFLDHLRGGGRRAQILSTLALGLAFLCNEIALAVPILLLGIPVCLGRAALPGLSPRRLLVAAAPHLGLTAVYAVFRFALLAPVDNPYWHEIVQPTRYAPTLGPQVLDHGAGLVANVFAGGPGFVAAALVVCALAALALHGAERGGLPAPWEVPLRISAASLGWLAVVLVPFATLPIPEARWSMNLEVPLCLLVGAWLDAAWKARAPTRPRLAEAALVLLLFASLPYGELRARAADPVGGPPRALARWIESQSPPLPPRSRLIVLYGAPGLAGAEDAKRLRYASFGRQLLDALRPGQALRLHLHDLGARDAPLPPRPEHVFLALRPGFEIERAGPALLERELPRAPGPSSTAPGAGGTHPAGR
jgi:hypothetical protein